MLLMISTFVTNNLDILLIPLLIALYSLPTIIAFKKGHSSAIAIATLNFFLGLSFLGWVISLVWALSNSNKTIITYHTKENHYKGLETIAKLKDKGILSEEEFFNLKKEILSERI